MTDTDNWLMLNHPPSPKARKWIGLCVVLFLTAQVVIPTSYYLRDEPNSERFAWRMFSSIDLCQWETKVVAMVEQNGKLVEQPIRLEAALQETYVKTIQQAQYDIVEPFLRTLSERDGVNEVRFEALGTLPSGKPLKPIRLSLKPGGRLKHLSD